MGSNPLHGPIESLAPGSYSGAAASTDRRSTYQNQVHNADQRTTTDVPFVLQCRSTSGFLHPFLDEKLSRHVWILWYGSPNGSQNEFSESLCPQGEKTKWFWNWRSGCEKETWRTFTQNNRNDKGQEAPASSNILARKIRQEWELFWPYCYRVKSLK